MPKLIDNLNYRQWQQRNSSIFNQLSKPEQKEIKVKGYVNRGWDKVQKSWQLLQQFPPKVVSIFDHKLAKGDLIGAINTAVIDADNASHIAQEAIKNIQENKARLNKLAKDTLAKYKPL